MPYLCTHLSFGYSLAQSLDGFVEPTDGAYLLGCLGPDIFFFDRLPPTPFVPHRKKHGNALHALPCDVLFDALLAEATPQDTPYLLGFLTHIALDSTLHPYIEAHHRGTDHTRFEGVIDSIVYQDTAASVPYESLLLRRFDASAIDALHARLARRLNLVEVEGAYRRSLRKFHRAAPLLFDPKGTRFRFLTRLERLLHREGLLSAFLLAAPREDREDAMNLGKHTWHSPFLPDASSDRSVPELFDEAKRYATALFDAYRSGDRAALMDLLKNRTMQKGATV